VICDCVGSDAYLSYAEALAASEPVLTEVMVDGGV
jgi:hypothetical protein